jgi:hypothetical protein
MTAPAEKPPPYSLCHFEIYPGRSPLNEAAWKRLLSQIRGACVVPVIGPELLVGRGREGGLPRRIAVGAA